ncbi:THO complex subunit mft1 [Lachnellula suecica]|uniref:THO complex subunit mft1 n=1 Tax=Lachnellula suecica TaxID=602035 RepID=A0A8T9CCY4_9HELO|nr:THO complex subunit mft1 [Lachnellula suecica]
MCQRLYNIVNGTERLEDKESVRSTHSTRLDLVAGEAAAQSTSELNLRKQYQNHDTKLPTMASFQPLDPREEEELHKSRLLNVEEKPFKRITKRLLTPGSLVSTPTNLPTPPPDSADEAAALESSRQKALEERRQFREDVLLDFAAFDSSIARIQFLSNSNAQERERYKADKQRILETAQNVRDSTVTLRVQLGEAKQTLEQRKKFDVLTEKITNNKLLRPRADQEINLKKLEEECRELERESSAYAETWKERREQFGRIVEEGMQLRRLIRDEKEEVERREGMDGGEEDGEVGEESRGGQTPKHSSVNGNATPLPDAPNADSPDQGLKPRPAVSGTLSRPGSRNPSRAPSPAVSERRSERRSDESAADIAEDTPMAEAAETPRVTIDEPAAENAPSLEDGEAEDKMDTT